MARSVIASGKIMSAPASTQARARSIAASSPSTASASVRAMIANAGSMRASTAAFTRSTISSFGTIALPGRWPQRLAPTWSSMCIAAAPALLSERTVRAMLNADAPKPVSTSTSSGSGRDVGDAADVDQHVVQVADAEVGQAERAGGDAAARQVERAVAGVLREQRVVRADRAGDLQRPFGRERVAQSLSGRAACGARSRDAVGQPSSEATPARSSSSSFSVAFILSREKSSIGRSLTIVYSPFAQVTGKPYMTSCGMP